MSNIKNLHYKAVWFDVFEVLRVRVCTIEYETDKYYDIIEYGAGDRNTTSRISKKDFKAQKWFDSEKEAIEHEQQSGLIEIDEALSTVIRALELHNLRKKAIEDALKII